MVLEWSILYHYNRLCRSLVHRILNWPWETYQRMWLNLLVNLSRAARLLKVRFVVFPSSICLCCHEICFFRNCLQSYKCWLPYLFRAIQHLSPSHSLKCFYSQKGYLFKLFHCFFFLIHIHTLAIFWSLRSFCWNLVIKFTPIVTCPDRFIILLQINSFFYQ